MQLTTMPNAGLPAGMRKRAKDALARANDMTPEEWSGLVGGLLEFFSEEADEPEHAEDDTECAIGCDAEFHEGDHPRSPDGKFGAGGGGGVKHEPKWSKNKKSNTEEARKVAESLGFATEPYSNPKSGAAYFAHGKLYFNAANKFWSDPVGRMKQQRELGHLSSDHPEHVIHHEIGHALYDAPDNFMNNESDRQTADKVSKYARMNPKEFVSEVYAGQQAGIEYPEDVIKLFDRYAKKRAAFASDSGLRLALDRASVRSFDKDGRLHVAETNVCKACVSPYKGDEIPEWEALGLDPEKVYMMLRPPDELEKAMPTINGVPLLRNHIPVDADDHQPYEIAGSIGTSAKWEAPFIKNALSIWPQKDIDGIESKKKAELSPGYHYVAVMEPGEFEGDAYDGKMTDIVFNHVAIVEEGRQGPEVMVGDDANEILWNALERALERWPA